MVHYEEYISPSTACSGDITTAVVWKLSKVWDTTLGKVGGTVTLSLPATIDIPQSGPHENFIYGHAVPSKYRPKQTISTATLIMDGNTVLVGRVNIDSSGVIAVFKSIDAGYAGVSMYFNSVGPNGLAYATSFSWVI